MGDNRDFFFRERVSRRLVNSFPEPKRFGALHFEVKLRQRFAQDVRCLSGIPRELLRASGRKSLPDQEFCKFELAAAPLRS